MRKAKATTRTSQVKKRNRDNAVRHAARGSTPTTTTRRMVDTNHATACSAYLNLKHMKSEFGTTHCVALKIVSLVVPESAQINAVFCLETLLQDNVLAGGRVPFRPSKAAVGRLGGAADCKRSPVLNHALRQRVFRGSHPVHTTNHEAQSTPLAHASIDCNIPGGTYW